MKPQILVDMDGVLADVYARFTAMHYADTGVKLSPEELQGKIEEEAFPLFYNHVRSPGFFRTAPLMPHSVEGLRYLNVKYNVLIVSSATEFPSSLIEKHQWLSEHFPFISWEQMIFCGRKDSITGDIMIDDHPKNLELFGGRKILFTQPHNALIDNKDDERVGSWKEIMEIL